MNTDIKTKLDITTFIQEMKKYLEQALDSPDTSQDIAWDKENPINNLEINPPTQETMNNIIKSLISHFQRLRVILQDYPKLKGKIERNEHQKLMEFQRELQYWASNRLPNTPAAQDIHCFIANQMSSVSYTRENAKALFVEVGIEKITLLLDKE